MAILERLLLAILVIIFGGVVLHAPLSVYLGVQFPEYVLAIKSWKEILLVLAGIVAAVLITRRSMWRRVTDDRMLTAVFCFVLVHVCLVAFSGDEWLAILAGLAIDLRFVVFFALTYILLMLRPEYRRTFLITGAVGASIVLGFGVAQLFLPRDVLASIGYGDTTIAPYITIDKNPDFVRINSTLRGPNPLGAYAMGVAACMVALAISAHSRRRVRAEAIAAGAASLVVLWVSYSRSAWIAAIAALAAVVIASGVRLSRLHWAMVTSVVFIGGLVVSSMAHSDFVSNVILHDNASTGGSELSNEQHLSSFVDGLTAVSKHPFGYGVGSTGSASLYGDRPFIIENQYLFVAHESGWLGLGIFLLIYGYILLCSWRLARRSRLAAGVFSSGLGMAVIGMLLPVFVDDTVSIVWWGLAAVVVVGGHATLRISGDTLRPGAHVSGNTLRSSARASSRVASKYRTRQDAGSVN